MAYCKINISPERICLNVIASVIMIVIQVIPENDQNMLPTNQKTAGSKLKQRHVSGLLEAFEKFLR